MKRLLAWFVALSVGGLLLFWIFKPGPRFSRLALGTPLPPGKVAPQLITTEDTAALIAPDGSLWLWGGNETGLTHLFPALTVLSRPQRVGSDSDWKKFSAGLTHVLALKTNGTLWGWGRNYEGEIAQPRSVTTTLKPTQIGVETNWADISVGMLHSVALKTDGSLWAWGQNNCGQVGDGSTNNNFTPTRISPDLDWKSISAGSFNGFALKSNGTVWVWGANPVNSLNAPKKNILAPEQLDPGTNWTFISASGFVLLALKSDGSLWIHGQNAHFVANYYVKSPPTKFTRIGNDTDWADAFAGGCLFARKRDGSWWVCEGVYAPGLFGLRNSGQIQRVPFDFEPWAFANGSGNSVTGNSLLLTKDGTLWTWGERLGAQVSPARLKLNRQLNRLLDKVTHEGGFRFNEQSKVIDSHPYRLWELPAAMRQALRTNSAAQK
jgi:alpha-tubulin suppressor-like RCC1 family protein